MVVQLYDGVGRFVGYTSRQIAMIWSVLSRIEQANTIIGRKHRETAGLISNLCRRLTKLNARPIP